VYAFWLSLTCGITIPSTIEMYAVVVFRAP
jgi:hypothetical protein